MSNTVVDFEAILNKPVDEIEKPKPLPVGTYIFLVKPFESLQKVLGKSSQKQTPQVTLQLVAQSAEEDVDASELEAFGQVVGKEVSNTFYLTPDAQYILKEFAEHCGVDGSGKSLGEVIQSLGGTYVKGYISHTPKENGDGVYANVKKFLPL